jgi:hypothetical protein
MGLQISVVFRSNRFRLSLHHQAAAMKNMNITATKWPILVPAGKNVTSYEENPFWHFPPVTAWLHCELLSLEQLMFWRLVRRSRQPCCLRRRSAVASLLGCQVLIPPGAWMSVPSECCVLSVRGLQWADPSSRGVLPSARVCACVRACVSECDQTQQTPLHLQWIGRRSQTKTERTRNDPQAHSDAFSNCQNTSFTFAWK